MTLERLVLIMIWITSFIAVALFIPRHKRREAVISFTACQAIVWLNSMLHVQYGLLAFPVREFPKATHLLLTSEFMLYPLIFAFYYVYEPESGKALRLLYLAGCITFLTAIDVILETYTELIEYLRFTWYWTWIEFFIIFLLSNFYCKWYFKQGVFYKDRKTAR